MVRRYTPIQLVDELYKWWMQFAHDTGIARGSENKVNVHRENKSVRVILPKEIYLLGFDAPTADEIESIFQYRIEKMKHGLKKPGDFERPEAVFFAQVARREPTISAFILNEEFTKNQRMAFEESNRVAKARYKTVFYSPNVEYGSLSFEGNPQSGLIVRSPLLRTPTGPHRGLSENLFVDSKRFILKPLIQIAY